MTPHHPFWPMVTGVALALGGPPAPPGAEGGPAVKLRAEEFPLSAVRLLDGPFKRAMEVDRAYLLRLEPDRLLAGFRREAGLPRKADPYGGWETIPAEGRWSLAGQALGHYLSALSLMASASGDGDCRRRADSIVDELAACQEAAGTGILCAFPESKGIFAELAAGRIRSDKLFNLNGGYVPLYVTHKVMAGLRDAWLLLGNRKSRDVLVRMADWQGTVFERLTDAQVQEVLETEHGGVMEVVADVHAITGDVRYLALARRLNHRSFFEPLARGEDRLTGMHANAQIPKVIGMERIYQLTGERDFGKAARFFRDEVVRRRSFVIGGHGENEFFFDPRDFAGVGLVSKSGPETCNTYNMVKLSRRLWLAEPSGGAADFIERALYNHILPSQDPVHGGLVYFTSMRPGHYRTYSSDTEDFWCCTDTGMENHAKYGEFIYARSGDRLWVDLLIPSQLDWADQGVTVRLETRFPEDGKATLAFTVKEPRRLAVAVRSPGWLKPGTMALSVNGAAEKAPAGPDSYAVVERVWKTGDRLEVEWPLAVRTEMLPRSEEWVSVLWGPVVLAGELGNAGLEGFDFNASHSYLATEALPIEDVPVFHGSPGDVAAKVRPAAGRPLSFRTEGLAAPSEVTLAPFYRVHHQRYALYWKLIAPRAAAGGPAGASRRDTGWFKDARYGVFMHFLPADARGLARVEEFDVEALARQLEAMGAKYFVITLGQNSGYFISPNTAYDRITGRAAGERCARRDLPLDLHRSLEPRGIRLMLYLPAQTPNEDPVAQKAFGLPEGARDQPIDREFAARWAEVIQEWSDRYREKVRGWWFDGCYGHVRFDDEIARTYGRAARHGNPGAIVAFNPGVRVVHLTPEEDYTAGELNEPFEAIPSSRWLEGSQWHALTYLGSNWSRRDTRHPETRWAAWVKAVAAHEGVVTLDMGPNWDPRAGPIGSLAEGQVKQVQAIRAALERS